MPDLTVQDMAARLRGERFTRTEPSAQTLGDPIADTPMIVTLDELRPYELNPRLTRNPKYDEIKTSIRERGLDAPPAITRRPGEPHFLIRSGGNTRLSVLRELWTETKDERFFRIPCLFRPWSERGEIVALTGHLAENELRGDLSFIERALGVEKARELYVQEMGRTLSHRELARRLSADGYPISHTLVNRMSDTIRYLLPAIPTVLYAGLGKPQVERLTALRKAGARVWERHVSGAETTVSFASVFQDVLSNFDSDAEGLRSQRVQDELVKQMARVLAADYDTLTLELIDAEGVGDALNRDPAGQPAFTTPALPVGADAPKSMSPPPRSSATTTPRTSPSTQEQRSAPTRASPQGEWSDDAESDGQTTHEPTAIPHTATEADAGPSFDTPDEMRAHIAQLVIDIASEGSLSEAIKAVNDGVGFICVTPPAKSSPPQFSRFQRALFALLSALSAPELASLSDIGITKAFEVFKLTRRLAASRDGSAQARRVSD